MTFFEILNSHQLKTDNLNSLKAYLKQKLNAVITQEGARQALGKDAPIKSIRNTKIDFNNALKNFHQKYFSAGNTILTVVSSLDSATVFSAVEKYFNKRYRYVSSA